MKEKIKYRRLDARDREYIAHNYAQGLSTSSIARFLNVHKSTISREIKRYSHRRGYTADYAQKLSNEQIQWKLEKRAQRFTNKMKQHICNKLRTEQWSPQQIVEDCRNRGLRMVGVTMIYKYLHRDKKRGGDLYRHTRHKLKSIVVEEAMSRVPISQRKGDVLSLFAPSTSMPKFTREIWRWI